MVTFATELISEGVISPPRVACHPFLAGFAALSISGPRKRVVMDRAAFMPPADRLAVRNTYEGETYVPQHPYQLKRHKHT